MSRQRSHHTRARGLYASDESVPTWTSTLDRGGGARARALARAIAGGLGPGTLDVFGEAGVRSLLDLVSTRARRIPSSAAGLLTLMAA